MTDELDLDLLADLVRRTLSPRPPRETLDYGDYAEEHD